MSTDTCTVWSPERQPDIWHLEEPMHEAAERAWRYSNDPRTVRLTGDTVTVYRGRAVPDDDIRSEFDDDEMTHAIHADDVCAMTAVWSGTDWSIRERPSILCVATTPCEDATDCFTAGRCLGSASVDVKVDASGWHDIRFVGLPGGGTQRLCLPPEAAERLREALGVVARSWPGPSR